MISSRRTIISLSWIKLDHRDIAFVEMNISPEINYRTLTGCDENKNRSMSSHVESIDQRGPTDWDEWIVWICRSQTSLTNERNKNELMIKRSSTPSLFASLLSPLWNRTVANSMTVEAESALWSISRIPRDELKWNKKVKSLADWSWEDENLSIINDIYLLNSKSKERISSIDWRDEWWSPLVIRDKNQTDLHGAVDVKTKKIRSSSLLNSEERERNRLITFISTNFEDPREEK